MENNLNSYLLPQYLYGDAQLEFPFDARVVREAVMLSDGIPMGVENEFLDSGNYSLLDNYSDEMNSVMDEAEKIVSNEIVESISDNLPGVSLNFDRCENGGPYGGLSIYVTINDEGLEELNEYASENGFDEWFSDEHFYENNLIARYGNHYCFRCDLNLDNKVEMKLLFMCKNEGLNIENAYN